jgi:hypothetical protein
MLSNIPLIGQAKIFNQNEEIIALTYVRFE